MFEFADRIRFTRAIYYSMKQIPLYKPFRGGTGGVGKFAPETGFLDLYDDEGCCTHHLAIGRGFVETTLPELFGDEKKSYNDWRHNLYWQMRNAGFQSDQAVGVGQVDLMMLDILAQRHGKPLHRFLETDKDQAVCYKGGGSLLLTDDELVGDVTRYVSEGYKTVKFKVGGDCGRDMKRDIRRIAKVREAVDSGVGITVDANQISGMENVVRFTKVVESYDLEWFEGPVHAHDMNGIGALKEMGVNQPLAFRESMRISYAYEIYLKKGVDHLQPSASRTTGMDDLLAIRDMCRVQGKTFPPGEHLYLNLLFGRLYNEDERIEYHEPISASVETYTLYPPTRKRSHFYWEDGLVGNPLHMNIEKLEKDGLLLSREIYPSG